ncbi:hypothetical protein CEUSTIGMA_g10422.t1 [Chlamydomonas eustigma]|uniref:RSE1/DDB1/CPSF1 first beta-propeller domain-containing protein n=1 Tax=Chlamydomonas eustigma TaxID=1157962 RepID=A0A250XIT7_9CHLO|nr:hypothetical protein CEUSTIGMA_g10422.t1 [Chlamydomonas eustigma]|eukprot:GAX82995.1 hypothetical protein CEUSTIGMA_g10422.t1 [Chlamydomonas eustigma]
MVPDVAVEGDAWLHKTLSPSSCVENACKGRFRSPKRIDVVISRGKSLELIELDDDGSFRTCSSQLVLGSIYQIKMLPSSSSACHKKGGLDLLLMTTSSRKLSVLKHASSIGRFVAICHVDLSTSPSAGQSGAYHDLGRHMALSPCSCCLALASLAGTVVIISVQTMLNHTAGHDDISSNKQCPDHDLGADACEPPQRQQEGALGNPAAADSNDIMVEVIDHQYTADDADIPQGSMIPWWHHHCSTEPYLLPLSACNPSWGLMVSKREVLLQQMGEQPQHAPAEGGSNLPTPPALPLFEEAGEDVAVFEEAGEDVAMFEEAAAGGEDIVADDDPTDGAVDHDDDVDEDEHLLVFGGGLLDGGVVVEDEVGLGHGQIDEDEAAQVVVATAAVSAQAVADSPGMVAEEDHDGNAHGEENNDILMDTDNDDVAFIAVAHLGDDEVTMPQQQQQQQLAFQLSRHSNQQEEAATADDDGDLYADEQLGHHSAAEEVEDEMMEDSVNVLPGMYWADEGLPQQAEEQHAEEVEEADINNVMLEVLQQQVPGQALGIADEPGVLPQDQLYVQQGGDVAVASSDDNVSGRDGITDEWDEGVGVQGFEHRYEASYLLHPDHHEGGRVGDDVAAAPSSASAPVDAATAGGASSSSLSHLQQELAVATAAAPVDAATAGGASSSSLFHLQQELAVATAAAHVAHVDAATAGGASSSSLYHLQQELAIATAAAPVDAATAGGASSSSLSHLQQELAVATAAAHVALDNAVMVLDTNSSLSYDLVEQELAAAASAAVAAAAAVVDMIMADEVAVAEGRLVESSWEDAGVAYERFFGDTASSSGSSGYGNNLSSSEDERANNYRSMHEEGDDGQHVVLDMCTVLGIQFLMNYREPHDDLSVINNSSNLFELPAAGQGVDCEGHCLVHKGVEAAAAASNHHQTDYFLAVLLQRPSVSRDEDAAGPLGGQPSSSVNQHINELRLLHHSVSRKRGVMGYPPSTPHLSSLTHITFEPRSCNNDADGDDDYEAADNYNAPISIRREGQHAGNCVDMLGYLSHLESIPNNPTGVLVFGERGVLAVHFDLKNIPPSSLPPKSAAGNNNSSGHVVGAVVAGSSTSATMSHAATNHCCILPLQQAGISSRSHLIQRVCCKLPLMTPSTLPDDGLELAVVTISAEHSGFRLQTGCSGEQRGAVVLEAMSCSSSSSRGGIIGLEPRLQRIYKESKTGSCVWSATCWLADSATSMQVEHNNSGSALQIINESKDAVIANRDSQLLYCTGAGRLFCLYVQSRSMMTLMQKPLTSVASGMQRPASFLYRLHPEGRVLYAEQMGDLLVLQLNMTACPSVPDPFIRGHSTAVASSSSASSSVLTNVVPEVRLLYCLPQLGAVLDLAGVNTSLGDAAAAIRGGAIQLHAVTASLPSIANNREAGHGQHGGVITNHDDDDDDDDAPSTLPQAVLCRLHTAYPSQTVLAFSPSLRIDDSYQSPAATPLKSFPIRGSASQQPPFSSLLLLSYFHCTRAVQLLAAPAMRKKTSEMQQQRYGGMRDVSDVLPGLVVHEPTLAAGVVSKDSLAQVTPSGFTLVEVSTESRGGRADSPTTTQTGPAVEDDGSCGLTGMLADIDLKSKEGDKHMALYTIGESTHAINRTEMKGSRQQKPRNKIRSASSNPGSWHPPPHLLGDMHFAQHMLGY